MKKLRVIIALAILVFVTPSHAQTWQAVGNGFPATSSSVRTMATYNNELYVGTRPNHDSILKWDGSLWHGVGKLSCRYSLPPIINSMVVYQGSLYIAGEFDSVNQIPTSSIARFDGSIWHAVGIAYPTQSGYIPEVRKLLVFDNDLYIAGKFNKIIDSTPCNNIARFDGTRIYPIPGDSYLTGPGCFSLGVYQNKLYIGGLTALWNCSRNQGITMVQNTDGPIYSLCEFDNKLAVGGSFTNFGGISINNLVIWDSIQAQSIGTIPEITSGRGSSVHSVASIDNQLYIGGFFTFIDSIQVNHIARYDGTWHALDNGIYGEISAIGEYANEIYAGGSFTLAGNTAIWNLAKMQKGVTVDVQQTSPILKKITVYPNPTTGQVTITSNTPFDEISIYDPLGQIVYSQHCSGIPIILSLETLPSGNYIVRVGTTITRLVKIH